MMTLIKILTIKIFFNLKIKSVAMKLTVMLILSCDLNQCELPILEGFKKD